MFGLSHFVFSTRRVRKTANGRARASARFARKKQRRGRVICALTSREERRVRFSRRVDIFTTRRSSSPPNLRIFPVRVRTRAVHHRTHDNVRLDCDADGPRRTLTRRGRRQRRIAPMMMQGGRGRINCRMRCSARWRTTITLCRDPPPRALRCTSPCAVSVSNNTRV